MRRIMKQSSNILTAIHSLPEYQRKMLAVATLVFVSILVLGGWLALLGPDVPDLASSDVTDRDGKTAQKLSDHMLSPAAGVLESFKGLGSLFRGEK